MMAKFVGWVIWLDANKPYCENGKVCLFTNCDEVQRVCRQFMFVTYGAVDADRWNTIKERYNK